MSKIKFSGIIGNNCGEVVPYNGEDKRLLEKGYTVKDGIPTLRGFARICDLAAASKAQYIAYQRDIQPDHVLDIGKFLDNCKTEAKFLPEVVLSVCIPKNVVLTRLNHKSFSSISRIAQGVIENLDYYTLEVDGVALSRVDGNHRLEAGKEKQFYVPFAIVLWNIDEGNSENLINPELLSTSIESEAFLFYILNNKAKRLEAEENFKGLVKSENWTSDELSLINKTLPILQHYFKKYYGSSLVENEFIESPLFQISEILTDIDDPDLDPDAFDILLKDAIKLLYQDDLFRYIKSEFQSVFFQLVFYARYKNENYDSTRKTLVLINNWLERYKYTCATFIKASNIYDIAYRYISASPKYIFMAMEYKSDEVVKDYNDCLYRAVHTINNMGSNTEIEAYPIMMGKGKSINITADIYKKIEDCAIFIADTTEANPNVMYELGIAHDKNKPIIMLREKSKRIKVPSDIISEYYYVFNGMHEMEVLLVRHIKAILESDYGTVFPG